LLFVLTPLLDAPRPLADAASVTPGDAASAAGVQSGDVNGDGLVNSTDALIILSYDAGLTVPFAVGQPGCPTTITQPPGCTP